jgi:hypothetical protein
MSGAVGFWLREGERDRRAEQVEGAPLGRGRVGQLVDGGAGRVGEGDLVAGQGAKVGQQGAEAVRRAAVVQPTAGCLGLGGG